MRPGASCMSCSKAAGGRWIPGPLATMYRGQCTICGREEDLAIPRNAHDMPDITEAFVTERRRQVQHTLEI